MRLKLTICDSKARNYTQARDESTIKKKTVEETDLREAARASRLHRENPRYRDNVTPHLPEAFISLSENRNYAPSVLHFGPWLEEVQGRGQKFRPGVLWSYQSSRIQGKA